MSEQALPAMGVSTDRLSRYVSRRGVNSPYLRWQLDQFGSNLGRRILEVGCGIGGIIEELGPRDIIYGLDVEPEVVEYAASRFIGRQECRIELLDITTCNDSEIQRLRGLLFDTILCINALEHIHDDALALRRMHSIVTVGGALALLVPAHRALYGAYDRLDGHFRRYDRPALRRLAVAAGFEVEIMQHFNALGAAGWWLQYHLLRRCGHGPAHFRVMSWLLPICRGLEGLVTPPFGLSLVAVLRKKAPES
jgi:SAM-dependent methyltransferase